MWRRWLGLELRKWIILHILALPRPLDLAIAGALYIWLCFFYYWIKLLKESPLCMYYFLISSHHSYRLGCGATHLVKILCCWKYASHVPVDDISMRSGFVLFGWHLKNITRNGVYICRCYRWLVNSRCWCHFCYPFCMSVPHSFSHLSF